MTKKEEYLKALQCLYLEVDASIADDVKRKVLDALDEANKNFVQPDVSINEGLQLENKKVPEVAVAFADWLWSDACANEYVHLDNGRWGKEKDGSIELQLQEYTTEEMFDIWWKKAKANGC